MRKRYDGKQVELGSGCIYVQNYPGGSIIYIAVSSASGTSVSCERPSLGRILRKNVDREGDPLEPMCCCEGEVEGGVACLRRSMPFGAQPQSFRCKRYHRGVIKWDRCPIKVWQLWATCPRKRARKIPDRPDSVPCVLQPASSLVTNLEDSSKSPRVQ